MDSKAAGYGVRLDWLDRNNLYCTGINLRWARQDGAKVALNDCVVTDPLIYPGVTYSIHTAIWSTDCPQNMRAQSLFICAAHKPV